MKRKYLQCGSYHSERPTGHRVEKGRQYAFVKLGGGGKNGEEKMKSGKGSKLKLFIQ